MGAPNCERRNIISIDHVEFNERMSMRLLAVSCMNEWRENMDDDFTFEFGNLAIGIIDVCVCCFSISLGFLKLRSLYFFLSERFSGNIHSNYSICGANDCTSNLNRNTAFRELVHWTCLLQDGMNESHLALSF